MKIESFRQSGYQLLHEGTRELARIEAAGIRIDLPLLKQTKRVLAEKIRDARNELEKDPLWKKWQKRFGGKTNPMARKQLSHVLYRELGIEATKTTQAGELSTDEEVLQSIDIPFTRNLAAYYRYEKTLNTFLKGIEWELVGDRIHPSFDLWTARTMRSSSSAPNFQNMPVRNKEISQIIRSLFIASSPRHVLAENDFKGIEVGVSACYHKDPVFIDYITTPGKDMHRDMAAQIYLLKPSQVSKDARYGAKNKFVFPQFYGDYYITCARSLWEWIDKGNLKIEGTTILLREHLRDKGITKLGACRPDLKPEPGTFEHHLREVEFDFWNNRFQKYGEWRKDFYHRYLDNGYFDILSGFRIHGVYSRNQVTNAPVQGAAFHCLLWSLIQIARTLRKYKIRRSFLVGQIHDSLIGDIHEGDLRDYLEIATDVTKNQLRRHFSWLNIPLEIEYEISPPGMPWSAKREYHFKDGKFKHPERDVWTSDPAAFLSAIAKGPAPVIPDRPIAGAERNGSFRSRHENKTKNKAV